MGTIVNVQYPVSTVLDSNQYQIKNAASGLVRVKVLIDNPDHKMKANMKASADFGKVK